MSKQKKKRTNGKKNNVPYTPNRNAFGEKAVTHLIKLKRETALSQLIDMFVSVYTSRTAIEYTIDCSAINPVEYEEIMSKAFQIANIIINNKSDMSFKNVI